MPQGEEKHYRMAIRRDIGNRQPSNPQPEPTGVYLVAHACFVCRKSYKLDQEREHACPECGGPLQWMGRSFKPPRRADAEQWAKVEALYRAGFRFGRYGGDYAPLPERLREVEAFVRAHPAHPLRTGSAG